MGLRLVAAASILALAAVINGVTVKLIPDVDELTKKTGESFFVKCDITDPSEPSVWDSAEQYWRRVTEDGREKDVNSEHGPVRSVDGVGLMFFNVSEAEGGKYRCVINFNGDRYVQDFVLKIIKKMVVDCPGEQHPVAGEPGSIACRVTADPAPDLIWYKDRKQIKDGHPRYRLEEGGTLLRMDSFDPAEDDGEWTVHIAQKASGDIQMRDISVSGYVRPAAINVSQAGPAYEANTLVIACKATGKPAPQFVWYKGDASSGVELVPGSKYSMSAEVSASALTISALTHEDSGLYTCLASNEVGDVEQELTVSVFLKPRIQPLQNRTVTRGADVRLDCDFSGDGEVTAYWTFRGHSLSFPEEGQAQSVEGAYTTLTDLPDSVDIVNGKRLSLHLDDVDLADADEYQCTASNTAGDDVERVFLSVYHAPALVSRSPEPVRARLGVLAHLDCEVEAVPAATWTWVDPSGSTIVSDGVRYTISTSADGAKSTLKLIPNAGGDFGGYTCVAENGEGEAVRETLTVLQITAPSEPYGLEAEEEHPNYAVLRVASLAESPEGSLPLNLTFYFAEEGEWLAALDGERDGFDWEATAETATLPFEEASGVFRVSRLEPETRYVFKVAATNEAGSSPLSSEALKYATSEPRAPAAPAFVVPQAGPICRSACALEWTEPNAHGADISGYRLKYFRVERDADGMNPVAVGPSLWLSFPAHERSARLAGLDPHSEYEFQLVAENERGQSEPTALIFKTMEMEGEGGGLGVGGTLALILFLLLLVLATVDVACCLLSRRGLSYRLYLSTCGAGRESKAKALEEGGASDRTPIKEKLASEDESAPLQSQSTEAAPTKPPNPNNPKDTQV